MTRVFDELLAVFQKDNFIFTLLGGILAWISPAAELLFLLYGLTVLDWCLDIRQFFKDESPKIDLWAKVTRPAIEKLCYYTALAVAVFATQLHLFKDSIPLYTVMMAIPISAELISVATTVERNTNIKVVSKLQEIFNSFIGSKGKTGEE